MVTTNLLTRLEVYAESIDVRIREAAVPIGLWGIYDNDHRLITLKPGMATAQRQSTLAHELGHAHYGHHGHHPKTERIADKWAARKLLNLDLVLEHAKDSIDMRALSASLSVMPWVLDTFVSLLDDHETRWITQKIRETA